MTPRRPDAPSTRRSPGSPFTIAAAVTLSACLLGSGALVAHADEGAAPAAAETTATAAVPASAAEASAPTSATAGSTPSLSTAPQDVAPAPIAPAVAPAPAPAASTPVSAPEAPARTTPDTATTPIAAASTVEVPTVVVETPVAPAPVTREAPAFEPAAATETPVSTPQQQPTPPAAATTDGVTATAQGALVLAPGEKPKVGTPVNWTITLHNNTPDAVFVLKTLVRLEPGESAQVDDNLPPATLTQADLDAGVVTYRSRYDIGANGSERILRVHGELTLPKAAPTPPPSQPTTPTTTPTTPTTPTVTTDGVTATAQGALVLAPGEKPKVGTPVNWTIILHNDTPDAVFVLKTLVRLEPGESAQVDDNLPPATLTQADLDAGVVTYRSRYDIGANGSERILRVHGELTLPKAAPTAPHSDRVTASVRAVPDLKPGEQVKVGTVVKWIVTFHHSTPDTASIGGTTLVLTSGRSGYVEDTTKPSTVTQADLDAGVVTYRSEFNVSTPEGSYTIPATGELTLPKPAPELPIGTTTDPATGTTPGTETGTITDGTTTGTATTAGTTAPVGSGAATTDESVAAGTDSPEHAAVGAAARTGAGVASPSAPTIADKASGSTSAKSSATKSASAAHLAQTGVDTAAALPAAGILGLLGALGLLLGARRRRNRTAD
ncbi:LPXTG cell wall anchor domain-containing protein [Rathayibacter sp. VKM Ac-2927]|uniref:LPXTG cell wall anchor domain-containing protein n=1 Tax=Rathayibacter sp. VKM Ac-2927 TaxID=2929478 RepID=UPI001FB29CA5|nr:LPXTG cell wall anchor domain-containing protein [Rathayibacter sp. VKM Ac-2927]MCJ1687046.1 LPXTG cell wall anchor domain-containing protein [Rathayibacter sp. VKM Ac-2927]